jgi:hypothetical protein
MSVLFLDWSLTERQGNLEVMASVNLLVHPIHFFLSYTLMHV